MERVTPKRGHLGTRVGDTSKLSPPIQVILKFEDKFQFKGEDVIPLIPLIMFIIQ